METFLASDGAALAFEDRGNPGATTLLFVHGWRADHTVWAPLIAQFGDGYRTIAVDLRGSGGSRRAPGPFTVEQFASDLGDLVDSLGLDPLTVVGHSMGGALAQRFAIDRPDAVEALVLIAPIPASGSPFKPAVEAYLRATVSDPVKSAAWLSQLIHPEADPALLETLGAAAASVPAESALATLDSWLRLDFAEEAATIETPTLILVPDRDPPMTPELQQAKVGALIAGSRLEVVDDSGHYAPLERPAEVAGRIEAFVARLAAV